VEAEEAEGTQHAEDDSLLTDFPIYLYFIYDGYLM
jgi:hypothetical protein